MTESNLASSGDEDHSLDRSVFVSCPSTKSRYPEGRTCRPLFVYETALPAQRSQRACIVELPSSASVKRAEIHTKSVGSLARTQDDVRVCELASQRAFWFEVGQKVLQVSPTPFKCALIPRRCQETTRIGTRLTSVVSSLLYFRGGRLLLDTNEGPLWVIVCTFGSRAGRPRWRCACLCL